ncbi:MAG: BCCT family transporter [Phycisphaeraceae bacterium]
MTGRRLGGINPVVFGISAGVIFAFVLIGAIWPDGVEEAFRAIQSFIVDQLGWFYVLSVTFFLLFVLWLLLSPYGSIRLGKDADEPEYHALTWFAMLFSAGMGIGLLFFSVAEPVMHFTDPPRGEAGTIEAAQQAMTITFFHWGLHAWAIYIIVGLALAYFAYRHDLPLTIRSTLYPLIGERIHGPLGDTVEILAVFGTLFGVATSLGLGVQQINAGLDYLGLLSVSTTNQIILIAVITLIATASVVSGLNVGIRRLSELNLGLSLTLLIFVLVVGPTVFLLSTLIESIGRYLTELVAITFRTDAYSGTEWQADWTMFYWGWWISWSPFVGMFIARISRGRTIRSFVMGVLLVPTLLTFIWMIVFGNTALHMELFSEASPIAATVAESPPTALFVMLFELPWARVTATLATLVIATYFVTSSDSASLVIDILTSSGRLHPPVWQRVFWALTEGLVAAILLLTGGLLALRTAAVTTALPFCFVMLVMCYSLVRGLRAELRAPLPAMPLGPQAEEIGAEVPENEEVPWRRRLRQIVGKPPRPRPEEETEEEPYLTEARRRMAEFINQTATPAFHSLARDLRQLGREVTLEKHTYHAAIQVGHERGVEFRYAIRTRAFRTARAAFPEMSPPDAPRLLRAEIIAHGGEQRDYALNQLSQQAVIEDFLHEYAKWMGW